MPTRFAKQLTQLVRGGVALGMGRQQAMRLAVRCARDSMPPLRLAILLDVAVHPGTSTREVRQRLNKPRATVDRQLQSLHMLGVLNCVEEDSQGRSVWRYTLADGIDPTTLDPGPVPDLSVDRGMGVRKEITEGNVHLHSLQVPTDKSGTGSVAEPRGARATDLASGRGMSRRTR